MNDLPFRYSSNDTHEQQIHNLMMAVPAYTAVQAWLRAQVRLFVVTFDNSKKRGAGRQIQSYDAEGIVFSSGHVVIDTLCAPRPDYASMQEMQEALGQWGNCKVVFDDE
jgi:hypothetical protein